jgi:transcriptional repressor NrdR
MKCPFCGKRSKIIDSRQKKDYYFRRHECPACKKRFTTHEVYDKDYNAPKAFIKVRVKKEG